MKKHLSKIFVKIFAFLGVAFSIISIITSCGNFVVIDSRGSSSVQPLLASLGNLYSNKNNVEISVQAGGSSIGISSIANSQTMMGNASKSPRSSVIGKLDIENKWQENSLKTITLGIDAIGIVLLPPNKTDNNWNIDQNNIVDLYKAFGGFERIQLNKFYIGSSTISNDITITPFARSGGALSSGTAEAFYKESKLLNDVSNLPNNVQDALSNGNYGRFTQITNESNSEAYTNFKVNAKTPGSMIYLSLGFIENNINTILNDGFVVMKYNNFDAKRENVSNKKYGWTRPFNTIISLKPNSKLDPLEKFISWILFSKFLFPEDYAEIQQIYLDQGLIFLQEDELKKMFLTNESTKILPLEELVKNHMNLFWKKDFDFSPIQFGVE